MEEGKKQNLSIINREKLTIDGVSDVLAFSDEYLEISSSLGIILVEGSELKIEGLSKENGIVNVKGKINGVFYKTEKSEKGIFSKFFK